MIVFECDHSRKFRFFLSICVSRPSALLFTLSELHHRQPAEAHQLPRHPGREEPEGPRTQRHHRTEDGGRRCVAHVCGKSQGRTLACRCKERSPSAANTWLFTPRHWFTHSLFPPPLTAAVIAETILFPAHDVPSFSPSILFRPVLGSVRNEVKGRRSM